MLPDESSIYQYCRHKTNERYQQNSKSFNLQNYNKLPAAQESTYVTLSYFLDIHISFFDLLSNFNVDFSSKNSDDLSHTKIHQVTFLP